MKLLSIEEKLTKYSQNSTYRYLASPHCEILYGGIIIQTSSTNKSTLTIFILILWDKHPLCLIMNCWIPLMHVYSECGRQSLRSNIALCCPSITEHPTMLTLEWHEVIKHTTVMTRVFRPAQAESQTATKAPTQPIVLKMHRL